MSTAEIERKATKRRSLAEMLNVEFDPHAEWLRNKREDTAMELTGLLHHVELSRAEVARKLDWKPSRVTRALSGNENLTINTLASIIEAAGMDYDIVFRPKGSCRNVQPWEIDTLGINVLQLHGELKEALGEVRHLHQRASITLESAEDINRAMFRRANEMKQAASIKNPKALVCEKIVYEENNEAIARTA